MSAAAAPAGARPSGARLPPSPSTTLCRPEQLRARQRAAAQAAAEEDVQALQALLGGGGGGPAEGQHSGIAGPAPSQSGAAPAPADEGCLSSATLQSLLPAAPPTQAQLQPQAWLARQGSSWVAGPAAHQDAGQPPGLAGEPSALTSYIMRLEEESSLVQRQLAHLQASTSSCGGGGGAGQGALPSLSRTARNPLAPGRREVFVLSQWLEVGGGWLVVGGRAGGAGAAAGGLTPAMFKAHC